MDNLRRKVWDVQLEMVSLILKICEENKLKCFAAGGTLLGAVRHNGYIPWDDDIDLMMPRVDYEKFLVVASKYIEGTKFFLQSDRTEKMYPNGHAQLRNSETTCLSKIENINLRLNKNCGIFVDIFPYDYIGSKFKIKRIAFLKKITSMKIFYKDGPNKLKNIIKKIIITLLCPTNNSVERKIRKIDKLASSVKKGNRVGLVSFMPGFSKNEWDKEWFDNLITYKFENMKILIPNEYDKVLKTEYGDDYMTPCKAASMHGDCLFDVDKSYKEYIGISDEEFSKLSFGNLD